MNQYTRSTRLFANLLIEVANRSNPSPENLMRSRFYTYELIRSERRHRGTSSHPRIDCKTPTILMGEIMLCFVSTTRIVRKITTSLTRGRQLDLFRKFDHPLQPVGKFIHTLWSDLRNRNLTSSIFRMWSRHLGESCRTSSRSSVWCFQAFFFSSDGDGLMSREGDPTMVSLGASIVVLLICMDWRLDGVAMP